MNRVKWQESIVSIISVKVIFNLSRVVVGRSRVHVRKCLPLKLPRQQV